MAREATATVRVSAAELAEWRRKARAAGVSLSELLRRAMARTRTWTAAAAAVERERTRELARIGNNLNQLARWGNTYKQGTDAVAVVAQLSACERGSRLGRRREEVTFSLGDGFSDRSCRPLSPLEVAMPALQAAGCNALPCNRRHEYIGSYLSKKPGEVHWKASREGERCMAAVNRGGGMTRRKVVKVAAMGIVLGIALGIVLSILALNLFIRLGDYSWLQHLLRFEAAKECLDQGENNKIVEAIRQKGAPGVRLLLEQGEDAQQEINCFGDTPLYPAIFQIQWGEPRPDRFEILKLLIQHGAEVNHVNELNRTPLHNAVSMISRDEDAVRVVEILLDAGADPLIRPRSEGFLGGYTMWSPYNQALTRGEFELAALMRARPGHVEPPNVKDLILRGEESLVEELTRADHPGEARRLAEKIRRRVDAGEWVTGKDVLQYLEQIEGRAADAASH